MFIIAGTTAAFAVPRGTAPAWAAAERGPACASPPCLDPLLLQDAEETKRYVEGFKDEVLAGAERLIRESRPVILLEIMGGKPYPGAPTLGYVPPAGPLASIHATWRTLEAFGYRVRPVQDYDYIALPNPDP